MPFDPSTPLPPPEPGSRRERRLRREAEERETGTRRPPGSAGRPRREKARRTWLQRLLLSVLVVGIVAAAGAASVVGYGLYKIEQIARVDVQLSPPPPPGAPQNFLLVGSDTRETLEGSGLNEAAFIGDGAEGSGQRSDTIMVVRVDPAAESLAVLSLPRDLWLPIADTGHSQRINTAYAGGPQRLVDTIETNFAVPIHHYVEVDFAGFAGLVDTVGGVPMWFDTPMRDPDSGLHVESAGCHVLDPQMALAFVRARHLEYRTDEGWSTDGTGDLGRITRQQVFLRRSIDKVREMDVTDAMALKQLADVGIDSVTLDDGLGFDQLLNLGKRFGDFGGEALRTYSLPVYPYTTSGGAAVLGLEEAEAQPVLNLFRGLPADALSPVQVEHVTVLNGTGEAGQAGLVADALEQLGFGIGEVADVEDAASIPVHRTRIRYGTGSEAAADLLERHLTAGADFVADPTLDDGELVLETGTDFTTVGRRPREASPTSPTTTTEPGSTTSTDGPVDSPSTTEPVGVAPDASATC